MAIAPSKLGSFVLSEGFSWPTAKSKALGLYAASDDALVRRLRETDLVRAEVTDADLTKTLQAARSEHIARGFSPFNSPHERVRVFLQPYLTDKGRRWAVPLESLGIPDDDVIAEPGSSPANATRPWWRFWQR